MPRFLAAVPIFRASNLATSIAYYTGTLGFVANGVYRNDPNGPDGYAFLSRDGVRIHLSSYGGDGPFATVAYFYVEGIDELHAEWSAAGADVLYDPGALTRGPNDQTWGMRELYVRDPDRNVLRFGQKLDRTAT